MFLRMVTHAVNDQQTDQFSATYEEVVLSGLRSVPGCAFASLLQNVDNPRECVSLTIWESQNDAAAYEAQGIFHRLVDTIRPFFLDSDEWTLQLSDNLSLEYTPLKSEPTVTYMPDPIAGSEMITKLHAKPFAVQIMTLTVQPEKMGAFESIVVERLMPHYQSQKAFIDLILLRRDHEYYVFSFWDETIDLHRSLGTKSQEEFVASVYSMLPSFIQWRVSHQRAASMSASTEDVTTRLYRCLAAEWFS